MNRLILSFLFSLLLVSCAGHNILRKTNSSSEDVLENESYLRFGPARLQKLQTSNDPIKQGIADCFEGKFKEGLARLKEIRLSQKENPHYWNQLGTCYYLSNQLPKAEFFYSLSLNIGKKKKASIAAPLNNLGMLRLRFGHYDEALSLFKEALSFDKKLRTPRFNMAQIYIRFSLYDKALPILKELETFSPKDKDIIASLSAIYLLKKNLKESSRYLGKLSSDDLAREDIAPHYAMVHFLKGNYEKAKEIILSSDKTRIREIKFMNKKIQNLINKKLQELYAQKRKEG